jgi:hypothetical protein
VCVKGWVVGVVQAGRQVGDAFEGPVQRLGIAKAALHSRASGRLLLPLGPAAQPRPSDGALARLDYGDTQDSAFAGVQRPRKQGVQARPLKRDTALRLSPVNRTAAASNTTVFLATVALLKRAITPPGTGGADSRPSKATAVFSPTSLAT